MKLYSFFNSSTSYRVRIALALKKAPYEYIGVNLREGEHKKPSYQTVNPSKGVPVLVCDNGEKLTQSMTIIQYLDELLPLPKLIPEDPTLRWRVLELANLIANDMHPVNNVRILGYLTNELNVLPQQKSEWYQHWITQGFDAVEKLLEQYGSLPYCFGNQPTLADCCLIPQVANAYRMGCDLSSYPLINKVYEHCLKHEAFIEADPKLQNDYVV